MGDVSPALPFRATCAATLAQSLGFASVCDGATFGAHLHCYRSAQHESHRHGECTVLCFDAADASCVAPGGCTTAASLAAELRGINVAARVANATRKKLLVCARDGCAENAMRIIELVNVM